MKFFIGILLYSTIFSSIVFFLEKSLSVIFLSAISTPLSTFIKSFFGLRMTLKLLSAFLNLNENP